MTLWHKPAYQPSDRCPITGDLVPGALPPGLYCEDAAAFAKLRAAARLRQSAVRGTLDGGWDLAGQRVFVCTPEQAKAFRAIASKAPPPPVEPEPDPVAGIEEEAAKLHVLMAPQPAPRASNRTELSGEVRVTMHQQGGLLRAVADGAKVVTGRDGVPRAVWHPFLGANRKAKRAAEARARRRA